MDNFHIGQRVRLAGGEPGTVVRRISDCPTLEPVCYVILLDQRRSNGDGYDVLKPEEMEAVAS